jgi:hypothetical protein
MRTGGARGQVLVREETGAVRLVGREIHPTGHHLPEVSAALGTTERAHCRRFDFHEREPNATQSFAVPVVLRLTLYTTTSPTSFSVLTSTTDPATATSRCRGRSRPPWRT